MRGFRVGLVAAVLFVGAVVADPPAAAAPSRSITCGGLVAYNRNTSGVASSQILAIPVTAAVDSTPARVIWDDPAENHGELDPAWSPDGRSIAFVTFEPAGVSPEGFALITTRLEVLQAGASAPTTVFEQLGQRGGMRHVTWSPDGKRIAYLTGVPPTGKGDQGLAWLHVIDVSTRTDHFVTGVELVAQRAVALTWSPRGDQLLLTAWEISTGNWTIYSARPDSVGVDPIAQVSNDRTRKPRVHVDLPVMYPAYLPGGNAVLVEHEATDEASTGLDLTSTRFIPFAPVLPANGFNGQADFGGSPLHAVYQHGAGGSLLTPDGSSIEILNLLSGRSHALVPATPGVLVEQPDWQPVLGCRPWPFAT